MKITTKNEALNIVETSYLASLSSLLWVALYYLPIGGALLRLILPLPIITPTDKLNLQLFSLNQHQPNQKAKMP